MRGALELLDPKELLGLMDVETDEKVKLPLVEATEANKINRKYQIYFEFQLFSKLLFLVNDLLLLFEMY